MVRQKLRRFPELGRPPTDLAKKGTILEKPGISQANIGTEYKGGDSMNRMLRYCPRCNTLTDQERIRGNWCCLVCTAKQSNPKEQEQQLKGDREYG